MALFQVLLDERVDLSGVVGPRRTQLEGLLIGDHRRMERRGRLARRGHEVHVHFVFTSAGRPASTASSVATASSMSPVDAV